MARTYRRSLLCGGRPDVAAYASWGNAVGCLRTADVEWLQILLRDVMHGDVQTTDWQSRLSPFTHAQSAECTLAKRLGHQHAVDAKSHHDPLSKESAGGRSDRRMAVDMNMLRETFQRTGATIRWVPHHLMVVDSMTKSHMSKGLRATTRWRNS